jgi:outer membrane protein OmpA-like peptidoglycan-associated protein
MRTPVATLLIAGVLFGAATSAQKYKESDAIPPGATGKVSPLRGKVLNIVGISSAVAGKAESLAAALKDLGARSSATEVRVELSADVLFDFDKAVLRPAADPALQKIATALANTPAAGITIEGHTDGVGGAEYNQRLSERRAAAVEAWLRSHGVASGISSKGFGASTPAVPNNNPDGSDNPANRQKKRRVEIVIKAG